MSNTINIAKNISFVIGAAVSTVQITANVDDADPLGLLWNPDAGASGLWELFYCTTDTGMNCITSRMRNATSQIP